MVIRQILNNNVVVTLDEQGRECVVCGRGIAYKKHVGSFIPENAVNKVFVAENSNERQRLVTLLAEIPLEQIQVADEIVQCIQQQTGKELSPSLYINLSDHIHTAVQRCLDGIEVKNSLLWDIRRYYEKEYALGEKALAIISERLHVDLPEDEAGFIALHIVNAEMDAENIAQVYKITQVIQEICNLVRYHFAIEFDENSTEYYRFVTHLKFLARRLVEAKQYDDHTADDLWEIMTRKYPETHQCVERIARFTAKKYNYVLSEDEKLYLLIHIERVVKKTKPV